MIYIRDFPGSFPLVIDVNVSMEDLPIADSGVVWNPAFDEMWLQLENPIHGGFLGFSS